MSADAVSCWEMYFLNCFEDGMAQWKAKHISIADKAIFGYKNKVIDDEELSAATVERTGEHF